MTKGSGKFVVLDPMPDAFPSGAKLAPRLDTLEGKTIAFLDNNKLQPRNEYFHRLGDMLKARAGVKEVIHTQKPYFTRPARPDVLNPILEHADAAVTGLGE